MLAFTSRLPPVVLLLALGGCGDNSGESTAGATTTDTDTGAGPTTESASAPATESASAPTTGAPDSSGEPEPLTTTEGPGTDPTTGDPSTGATTGSVSADCGFDDSLEFNRLGTIWQLRSEDGETCVWLERRDDSEPDVIYKAVPFTLLEFKAGHLGTLRHLSDPGRMSWASTHHNWTDVAEAWDDALRLRLEDRFTADDAFVDQFDVSAIDEQSQAVLWGPVRLYPHRP